MLNTGVLSLVVEDVDKVSKAAISDIDLPTNIRSESESVTLLEATKNRAVFIKYLEMHFGNYRKEKGDTALKYEMEYVLCGKDNDKENLAATTKKLVTARCGINLLYLLSNTQKREEAKAIAVSAATAIGVPFLYVVIEGVLLEAWALSEAVIDVRGLLSGEKLELLKSDKNWRTQLKNLGGVSQGKENNKGLYYSEYLEILLMLQNTRNTVFRTMDLIQVNVQKRYNYGFLMQKSFCNADVTINFSMPPVFTAIPFVAANLSGNGQGYEFDININYGY